MSKWETRIKKILDEEKQKHTAVYELNKRLNELIHGFSPIDKNLLLQEIKKTCESVRLIESKVTDISFEPRFKQSENKECDQIITITIKGDFNGYIKFETGSGYRNTDDGRIDIFYVWSSNNEIVSLKEQQSRNVYKKFKDSTVEKLIDIAMENKYYLTYEDCYKNYEIWDRQPSEYGDSVKGDLKLYDENKYYKRYKSKFENLNKITKYGSVEEYAEKELDASHESTTYEWYEYKL